MKRDRLTYEEYMNGINPMIVDNGFLMLIKDEQDLELPPNIRVYARISPENKAFIVRSLKNTISNNTKKMTKL